MLDELMKRQIRRMTLAYWQNEVTEPEFARLASGKEIGHRIADLVDERTTALIEGQFSTARECFAKGKLKQRSMGDIWVLCNGMYNPVNVKAGEADKNGQPNMVSLKKLLRALLLRQIDSYYLLIVKMRLAARPIGVSVYLVDALDFLQYITYDSGPGQMMLKERQFYEAMETGEAPAGLSLNDKIDVLFDLLEDADRRLVENRIRVMNDIKTLRERYDAIQNQRIDQSPLHLR